MKVALMITCLGDVLRPEVGHATVNVLRRLGHQVLFPKDQTCCGQPMFNSGYHDLAAQQARFTIDVFGKLDCPIVVPSGSCAAMVKHEYPHVLADDNQWHARALALAERTHELGDFLVNVLGVVDVGAQYSGTVTYHMACHLRPMGLVKEAETLIQNVRGVTYVPLPRSDQCCGFGGSFSVRYPEVSTAMVQDKVECILQTQAQTVVSTDAGCLMNIGGRLRRQATPVKVMHLAELLDSRE